MTVGRASRGIQS
ncbi:hypothetical protein LEMLEM_LOCUS26017 [Lemmus lemmus]